MTIHATLTLPYANRQEAGRFLAERLRHEVALHDPVVLALPRGGVPVAFEVSERLGAPLDIVVVRKLGVPGREELAMGAIAAGGVRVLDRQTVAELGISDAEIERVVAHEQRELARREREYRQGRPRVPVAGREAVLVDDGLATGASMRAAALAVRGEQPARVIVATPVGSTQACADLDSSVDYVLCAATPVPFYGVGAWYRNFAPTTDEEVRGFLARAHARVDRAKPRDS